MVGSFTRKKAADFHINDVEGWLVGWFPHGELRLIVSFTCKRSGLRIKELADWLVRLGVNIGEV